MSASSNGSPPSGDGPEGRRGEMSPTEREAFRKRAETLGKRLDEVRARQVEPSVEESRARGSAMGQAFKIAVELVAGVVVGGGIGWYLDAWLGTKPWLFIVFLMLGFAAGMRKHLADLRVPARAGDARHEMGQGIGVAHPA